MLTHTATAAIAAKDPSAESHSGTQFPFDRGIAQGEVDTVVTASDYQLDPDWTYAAC